MASTGEGLRTLRRLAMAAAALIVLALPAGAETHEANGHGAPEATAHEGAPEAASEIGAAAVAETPQGVQPYQIVRSLQFLQDQIAKGNRAALPVHASLLRRYATAFEDADPAVWDDPRNVRAAALFTLSGGPPHMLRALRSALGEPLSREPLFAGAQAYGEQKTRKALAEFAKVDRLGLDPVLGAQLDLVTASLVQASDPAVALIHLAAVRLAVPGTLLEESALRLGLILAEADGDYAAADAMARRYFQAFARSVYADNFRARFAAVYAERSGAEVQTIHTILRLIEPIALSEKTGILLSVSRRALVKGNLHLAGLAAEEALSRGLETDGDRERAELYQAAATIDRNSFEASKARLEGVDRAMLLEADVALLDAAFGVVRRIETPIGMADASLAAEMDGGAASELLSRGEDLLRTLSNELGEDGR